MSTPLTEDVEDDYDDYYVWPDEGEDEEDLEAAIFDLEAPPLTLMMVGLRPGCDSASDWSALRVPYPDLSTPGRGVRRCTDRAVMTS